MTEATPHHGLIAPGNAHPGITHLLTGDAWVSTLREILAAPLPSILISVYMISPYWDTKHDGTSLLTMLSALPRLGTKAHLLIASISPAIAARPFNLAAAHRLQAHGWQIRTLRENHEKTWVFADAWTIIGSHNISHTSATHDSDASVLIESRTLARQVTQRYWGRWARASNLLTPQAPPNGKNRPDRLTPVIGRGLRGGHP